MPTTASPRAVRRCAQCMPMKPATPVTRTFMRENENRDSPYFSRSPFSLLLGPVELDQLGVLHVAVHAADRDVQEPGDAVEESQAQDVELDEAHHRRKHEVCCPRAHPALERLARGEGGIAVLALEVP